MLEQTIELFDQILSPFAHHDFRIGKGMRRRLDQLANTVRLVAEFGLLRLSQPAVWIFDWSSVADTARNQKSSEPSHKSIQKNMEIMVTFPDFGRVTTYDGRPLRRDDPTTIREGSYIVLNRLLRSGTDQTRPGHPIPQSDRYPRTQPPTAGQTSYDPAYALDTPLTQDQQHRPDRYDQTTPRFEKPAYVPRRHSDLAQESMGLGYGSPQQKHAVYGEPGVVYNQKRDSTTSGGRQRSHGPIG
jgi:hypothetical protein